MTSVVRLLIAEAYEFGVAACKAVGAGAPSCQSLIKATIAAERAGKSNLGFGHLPDYLKSFAEGRINTNPDPIATRPLPAFLASDADRGIAQLGFDRAFDDIVSMGERLGIAVFTQRNSYSTGELGYYVRRLADRGLLALGFTNANAVLAAAHGFPRVYGTNPLACAFPMPDGKSALVIDQASSETALVNVIAAASRGSSIPIGWAIAPDGSPTTDAAQALNGALLPFGGRKGANIALLVEMLAAGVSGGNWSLDAPDFNTGHQSPLCGLTIVVIKPDAATPGAIERAGGHVDRLRGMGVYVPGISGTDHLETPYISMSVETHRLIERFIDCA